MSISYFETMNMLQLGKYIIFKHASLQLKFNNYIHNGCNGVSVKTDVVQLLIDFQLSYVEHEFFHHDNHIENQNSIINSYDVKPFEVVNLHQEFFSCFGMATFCKTLLEIGDMMNSEHCIHLKIIILVFSNFFIVKKQRTHDKRQICITTQIQSNGQ